MLRRKHHKKKIRKFWKNEIQLCLLTKYNMNIEFSARKCVEPTVEPEEATERQRPPTIDRRKIIHIKSVAEPSQRHETHESSDEYLNEKLSSVAWRGNACI